MNFLKKPAIWGISTIIIVAGGIWWLVSSKNSQPGKYDALAQCITDSGAKFYGTFWCAHCQNQKQAFGKSADLLPYVECSTPDGNGQVEECTKAKITSTPTWIFADGTRKEGELSLEELSEITKCELPK